jgi:formate/nitrite transporter FocA (FNT family)
MHVPFGPGLAPWTPSTPSHHQGRVNVQWSVNFLRGVGCNWFVALALLLSLGSVESVSKIYCIWIPIWAFVILGYQHSIANFFQVPLGMFYGTNFGVGKFIYQSTIPVTLRALSGILYLGRWCFGVGMEDMMCLMKRNSH